MADVIEISKWMVWIDIVPPMQWSVHISVMAVIKQLCWVYVNPTENGWSWLNYYAPAPICN